MYTMYLKKHVRYTFLQSLELFLVQTNWTTKHIKYVQIKALGMYKSL
jgi:hypothetical protein